MKPTTPLVTVVQYWSTPLLTVAATAAGVTDGAGPPAGCATTTRTSCLTAPAATETLVAATPDPVELEAAEGVDTTWTLETSAPADGSCEACTPRSVVAHPAP